jgi:hypothetical protein
VTNEQVIIDREEVRVMFRRTADEQAGAGNAPRRSYARERLEGDPPAVYRLIKPTFERLASRPDLDPTRPAIEFYRRHDVIDLLLPVAP